MMFSLIYIYFRDDILFIYFIVFKINGLVSLLYILFPCIILIGLQDFLDLDIFNIERINFYVSPFIRLFLIFDNITVIFGIFWS